MVVRSDMDVLHQALQLLAAHLYSVVFLSFFIEGAGIPFPSRIILIIAATVSPDLRSLPGLVAVAATGAVIGDHVPYAAGKLMGSRLLVLYCRLTLGSERCVENTVAYFVRFRTAALLLSRFSTSVRIFASALAGCGHIAYGRFVIYDVIGTVVYAVVWVVVGYFIGQPAIDMIDRAGRARLLLLLGPLAFAALLGYRLWRRSRYGPAEADRLRLASVTACEVVAPKGTGRSD